MIINSVSFSQTDSTDIYNFTFEQLSKLKITSATKVPQELGKVASNVHIIKSSEIKEKGYFTLEEVLSDLPGMQFRNVLGMNSYVFQRGIPNQNNLILLLIDGVKINELNSGGFYGGGQYNLSNVERIEVIYGPVSVTYGTNAISGIINIITKNPKSNNIEANNTVGSFNTVNSSASYSYFNDQKNIGIHVAGMYKQSDKANLKGENGDNNWSDLMENFEHDYSLQVKIETKNFIFGSDYLQKQSSLSTNYKSTGTIYKDYGSLWNIRFLNNYIKYNKTLNKNWTFSSLIYHRSSTVLKNTVMVVDSAQIGSYRPGYSSQFENILNYDRKKRFSVSGGISFGFNLLASKYSDTYSSSAIESPPDPPKPTMNTNYLISAFIHPKITLMKSLYFSGGLRFDHSSIYGQVFTPNIGLNYNFRKHIFRISYNEAFRAPQPWDYTDGLGNSDLKPEKMKSLESSVTFSINPNARIDFCAYINKLNGALTKHFIGQSYYWANEAEINTRGAELFFIYNTEKVKTSVNYTFTDSYNINKLPVAEISKHSGNASITYTLYNDIKLNIRANYVGKRRNNAFINSLNSYYLEPFIVFHGAMSLMNYKDFSLQFIVKNIFNKEYYHTSNRTPSRYRQPQRTLLLSISYSIKNEVKK